MKRNMRLALTAVPSLGILGSGAPAWSQAPPIADVDFMAVALTYGAAEVRASELARSQAQAKEVQEFARKVIGQQVPLDRGLATLARDNDVPVLTNVEQGRRQAESQLGKLRGHAFDQAVLEYHIQNLTRFIALSERCARG